MLNLTWDTNCLITLESDEPHRAADKAALQRLLQLHGLGLVQVRLSAGTASELQPDRTYLEHMDQFQRRRTTAGLGNLALLYPPARFDMTFWDNAVLIDDADEQQIQELFAVMFPGKRYDPPVDFDPTSKATREWINRVIDAEMYWSHLKGDGDLFVTRNSKDFIDGGRRERLLAFGGRAVEVPPDAVQWVDKTLS
ncbi:hypothetical protein [Glycomyces tarimensis]